MVPADSNLEVLLIGLLFMAVVIAVAHIRNVESRRIREKYRQDEILLSSYGVQFFGVESEPGKPLKSTGTLVMTKDEIYYRAKFLRREITIPGKAITSISVVDMFKNKLTYVKIIAINFINSEGERDRAGFRIPFPERWNEAISKAYLRQGQP
jgi:hypothetical protein